MINALSAVGTDELRDVSEGFRELKTWPQSAGEEPTPRTSLEEEGSLLPFSSPFLHPSLDKQPLSSSCVPSTGWSQGSPLAPSMPRARGRVSYFEPHPHPWNLPETWPF